MQNAAFGRAIEVLEKNHFVILSGIPGIGKTTLAEMIILHYLSEGFKMIKISQDISEAYQITVKDKYIYYYDDFLGQTQLQDKLNKNEDDVLIRFIEGIQKKPDCRFIMTTREYILNQAKRLYEKLSKDEFHYGKCIVSLEDYDKTAKAHILYNHIYYSDLPDEYKMEFAKSRKWHSIIEHKNYNPRIIDSMTKIIKLGETTAADYTNSFLKALDNPNEIWDHAFENQLSNASRNLLLVLYSLSGNENYENLKKCFNKYHIGISQKYNNPVSELDFDNALRELEGSFIKISKDYNKMFIKYDNPSIKDFLDNYLESHPDLVVQVTSYFFYFKQIKYFCRIERIRNILIQYPTVIEQAIESTIDNPCYKEIRFDEGIGTQIIDTPYELRAKDCMDICEIIGSTMLRKLIPRIIKSLVEYLREYGVESNMSDVWEFYQNFDEKKYLNIDEIREYNNSIKEYVFNKTEDEPWLDNFEILSKYLKNNIVTSEDQDRYDMLLDDFISTDYLNETFDFDTSNEFEGYIEKFKDLMKENNISEKQYSRTVYYLMEKENELQLEEDERADSDYDEWKDQQSIEKLERDDIDSMFDSLRSL